MDAKTALKYAEDQGAKFFSVRFTDLVGAWHHLSYPISQLTEDSFEDGFGFDASSLRGWAAINESDMLLVPDPVRFWMDAYAEEPTLCLVANVVEPITKEGYPLDPRSVARRAENCVATSNFQQRLAAKRHVAARYVLGLRVGKQDVYGAAGCIGNAVGDEAVARGCDVRAADPGVRRS